jgi:hypothetical protein
MFQQEQTNERPFIQGGQGAQTQLNQLLGTGPNNGSGGYGSLNTPFTMDNFKQLSPQYNFDAQQGAQGVLNNSSSGQGALSGAALKDLSSYNMNNANNSFNSAFANYNTQQNNIFARLSNIATLGSSAGSNSTTGAGQFAGTIGNTMGAIGQSQASGIIGASNNLGGGLTALAGSGAFGAPSSTVGYTPSNDASQSGTTAGWAGNPYAVS